MNRSNEATLVSGVFRGARLPATVLILLVTCGSGLTDTVYLKNGALIDGTVTHRTDESILLQIGKIGKLEIPVAEIYLIEKNKRTGGELLKSSVDTKGKIEFPSDKKSDKDSDGEEPGDAEDPGGEPADDGEDQDADEDAHGVDDEPVVDPPVLGEEEEQIDPELKKRIEQLVGDLDRQKRRYRVRAERHLKAIGRPSIPFLVPLATSDRDLTRIAVMRLFHAFGDDRVIEPCVDALLDVNEYVRDYANKTLIRVTGEDFGYTSQASPRRRELAQRKWARWWEEETRDLEETRRAASRAGSER